LATSTDSPGKVVQSWVPAELAEELKRHARSERRSVSAVVRLAIEDSLALPDEPERPKTKGRKI
jgi:hypothetical protein